MRWRSGSSVLLGLWLVAGATGASPWPGRATRIERELASDDVEVRRRAGRELGALSDATAARAVEKALSDDDVEVRLAAARRARELGPRGWGPLVVPWLREPHAELRLAALLLLRDEPSEVTAQELGRLLVDPSREVRRATVEVFGRSSERGAEVNGFLGGIVADPEPSVRAAVAEALGRAGGPGASRLLVGLLKDSDKELRRAAVVAWGALGEPEAEGALLLGLEDLDVSVAQAAARSWGIWSDATVVPRLLAWFGRGGWTPVHGELARGLGFEDDARVAAALIARADEAATRESLVSALVARGEAVTPLLERCERESVGAKLEFCLRLLVARDPGARAGDVPRAVRAGRLPERAALEILRVAADAEDAVIFALERLSSDDVRARELALQVLEASSRLDSAHLEPVRQALHAPGLSVAERARLLALLACDPAKEDFPRAETFLGATDPRLGRSAARVIAHAPDPARVVQLLGDAAWGEVAANELARRAPPGELARVLVERLGEAGARERARLLRALSELPPDAPRELAQGLARHLERARGDERDLLLGILLRLDHAAPELELEARRGDLEDRAFLAASSSARGGPELARILARDPEPTVRLLALGSLGLVGLREDAVLLAERLRSEERRERLAALLALTRLGERHEGLLGALDPGDLHDGASGDPVGRLAELAFDAARGAPGALERARRALCLDESPEVRFTAVRLLVAPSPDEAGSVGRALRSAAFYDPDRFVAARARELARPRALSASAGTISRSASASSSPRRTTLVRRADGSGPLPSALVPAFDAEGRFVILRTDRAGRVTLPDPEARLLAPSLLY